MISAGRKLFGMCFAFFILSTSILWAQDVQISNTQEEAYEETQDVQISNTHEEDSVETMEFMDWIMSDKCIPELEEYFDGFVSIRCEWIDTVSHRCLLVDFRPHLITPRPYILTIISHKYPISLDPKYFETIYDDKRHTGVFVVCFDECKVDTKRLIVICFIPYTDYAGHTIIELE